MKKINALILVILCIFLVTLSSCSSSQTFTVQGVPGTVISSPTNQRLAVIDNMGQAQIKMKRSECYYHYLQAQVPGSNLQVPFALDYRNHSRAAQRGACAVGEVTMVAVSMVGLVGGTMLAIADEGTTGGYFLLGALGGGLGALPFAAGNYVDMINHDYDYLKTQTTNSEILR